MRSWIRVLLVTAPLMTVACKKKESAVESPVASEPAPAPAPARPALAWKLGPAQLVGSNDATLTIPVRVQNNSGKAVVVKRYNVGIHSDSGRVCVLTGDDIHRTEGDELSFQLRGSCDATKVPAGDSVRLVGSFTYTNGDDEQKYDVDQDVKINR